ncbi:CesT family type III secretion system chaperone [Aeromonas dhakensis]|uniref:CesT family type III secretion system chaperone n=1 Tax=Aeromonas dhakensis TaxID=196024 RepID=UPI001F011DED|nr:CesT family type III secretion system chaperone [Aeromonas dhakensis]MDX7740060.1 CesT family type III secretion system chaperone [Aeromonas dhakensis]WAG00845.1 CesT family type III secretion system chaperone [Aeromonas dhakensis]
MKAYQQTVSEWLSLAGEQQGVALSLGSDGHCRVPFGQDGECLVEVPDNDELQACYLYIPLLRLPEDTNGQLTLTRAALELNMFGLVTGGSQISLDSRSNHLVLTFSSLIEMLDRALFMQTLGEFLDLGVTLLGQLQSVLAQQESPSRPSPLSGVIIPC